MRVRFCSNCGRETGHQRKLGFGTLFAVICTLGWWFLVIPFYPKRCTICGSSDFSPMPDLQAPRPLLSSQQILSAQTKQCPKCAESIKFSAQKCRYCGEQFDPDQVKQAVADRLAAFTRGSPFCPHCGESGVIPSAMLPSGGYGPWCPHCQKPATPKK